LWSQAKAEIFFFLFPIFHLLLGYSSIDINSITEWEN
jgi:hypothetical protein